MDYDLGEPDGAAVEVSPDLWRRRFGATNAETGQVTTVWWDNKKEKGNVTWAHTSPPTPSPPEAPTPPPAPTPPLPIISCGASGASSTVTANATFGKDDVGRKAGVTSAAACCEFCAKTEGCVEWAWHGEDDPHKTCHAHGPQSSKMYPLKGVTAGVMKK